MVCKRVPSPLRGEGRVRGQITPHASRISAMANSTMPTMMTPSPAAPIEHQGMTRGAPPLLS
jgi:hypothetical protein